jgi:hypothetical protein
MRTPADKVIFRIEGTGRNESVVALFPRLAATYDPWFCTCYAHLGQHATADPRYMRLTRPASPKQYRELARELRGRGYRVHVGHRFTRADLEERRRQVAQ